MSRWFCMMVVLFGSLPAAWADAGKKAPPPRREDGANEQTPSPHPPKSKKPARHIDLTPSRLLRGTPSVGSPLALGQRPAESSPGVRFGDGTWKTHAAQVGGMVAGFAALAAICGGARCLLPKGLTDWVPGTQDYQQPTLPGPQTGGLRQVDRPSAPQVSPASRR